MVRKLPLSRLVLTMKNGTTAVQNQEKSGVPVTRIETISAGSIDLERVRYTKLDATEINRWRLLNGDILLSHINSVEHIGKSAIYSGNPDVLIHGMNLLLLRADIKVVLPEYLHFALRSCGVRDHIRARCKRAINQASINQKELGAIEILVPALDEQRRIVDLLSRAEGIVRLRRDAQKKAAGLIPAIFLNMFGDPATNPKGWPVQPLGEVASFMSGGTPPKAREELWSGTLPWVSPKDMKVDCIADAIDHVSDSVLTETNLKLVPIGSILIVVRGMILVHTVPIAITSTPVTINQDMKALMPIKSIDPSFLLWALKVQHTKLLALVDTAAHGTKKLDTAKIQAVGIPVPPLQIQRQFIARADSVASIMAQQDSALNKAKATFEALLARSFTTEALA